MTPSLDPEIIISAGLLVKFTAEILSKCSKGDDLGSAIGFTATEDCPGVALKNPLLFNRLPMLK